MGSKVLYWDTNSIAYVTNTNGVNLLDIYKKVAEADGYTVVITDVVREEIRSSKILEARVGNWLEKNNIAVQSTTEYPKYKEYWDAIENGDIKKGQSLPSGYNALNAGERSIVEDAIQAKQAGQDVKIFSDDKFFGKDQSIRNASRDKIQELGLVLDDPKKLLITTNDVRNNSHMLTEAFDQGAISVEDYKDFRDKLLSHKDINGSERLRSGFIYDKALAQDTKVIIDGDLASAKGMNSIGHSHKFAKGAAGIGIAVSAWEWYNDGTKIIGLHNLGNDTAAMSELDRVTTEATFIGLGASAGAAIGSSIAGAYVGSEAGVLSPVPPHPLLKAGAIIGGGIVGGAVGYSAADDAHNESIQKQMNTQKDHDGNVWHRGDDGEWTRREVVSDATILEAEVVMHQAIGDVKKFLDYQAATESFELGMANIPAPKDPYSIANNDPASYISTTPWVKNLETEEWSRSITAINFNAVSGPTEVATPEKANELDKQSQNIIYENAMNSPAIKALRYLSNYEKEGWESVGDIPELFTKINNLEIMAASDDNIYKLDDNQQWIYEGLIWDSKASPKIEYELNATRAAMDNVRQSNQRFLSQDIAKETERSHEPEITADAIDMSTWSSGDAQFDALYAAAISDDPNALREVCKEISESEFGQKFQAEIDQLCQLEQQQIEQQRQQQLLEQEQREQAQRAKQNEGQSLGR